MNPVTLVPSAAGDPRLRAYQDVKARIHNDLLNRLNLERLTQVGQADAEPEIRRLILDLIERGSDTTPLSLAERETLVTDVLNELFGLGPLEALLRDGAISDILVNRFDQVYIERDGRLELTDIMTGHYNAGVAYLAAGRYSDARASFEAVRLAHPLGRIARARAEQARTLANSTIALGPRVGAAERRP